MTRVFADTFYYLAWLNPADEAHEACRAVLSDRTIRLVTSDWVLTELGDGLAATGHRRLFGDLVGAVRTDPRTRLIGFSRSAFDAALTLYRSRGDKQWSLTDCTSFVIMRRLKLVDALTVDHHFEQAGFQALLM